MMKKLHSLKKRDGFTLIETTLSIAFISILVLAIGQVTLGMVSLYRKGISMKTINTAALELINDFENSIMLAPSGPRDTDTNHFYISKTGNAGVSGNVQLWGKLCTGKYTYAWNTGYALNKDNQYGTSDVDQLKYKQTESSSPKGEFRLIKFIDTQKTTCKVDVDGDFTLPSATTKVEVVIPEESDYMIYNFEIERVDSYTNNRIYNGYLTLGTTTGKVDVTSSGNYCKNRTEGFDYEADFCAINKFNFSARALGGVSR